MNKQLTVTFLKYFFQLIIIIIIIIAHILIIIMIHLFLYSAFKG